MVEVDLGSLLGYPVQRDWLPTYLVGAGVPVVVMVGGLVGAVAALFLAPELGPLLLLVPALLLAVGAVWTGYFVRVARRSYAGDERPPGLGNVRSLARDAAMGSVVVASYLLPGVVLAAGSVLLFTEGISWLVTDRGFGEGLFVFALYGGMLLATGFGLLYLLVVSYLLPVSLSGYAATDDLRSAFSLSRFRALGLSAEYALPWLVVAVVGGAILGFVQVLIQLVVGYLLVPLLPLVLFYLGTVGFHAFGRATAAAYPRRRERARRGAAEGWQSSD